MCPVGILDHTEVIRDHSGAHLRDSIESFMKSQLFKLFHDLFLKQFAVI